MLAPAPRQHAGRRPPGSVRKPHLACRFFTAKIDIGCRGLRGHVYAATARRADVLPLRREPTRATPAFCRVTATADADRRLGHQGRGVAAEDRVERKASGRRQRWIRRHDFLHCAGRRGERRLCRVEHRHRTLDSGCVVRDRTRREARRLRASFAARAGRLVEGNHQRVLRQRARRSRCGTGARRVEIRA